MIKTSKRVYRKNDDSPSFAGEIEPQLGQLSAITLRKQRDDLLEVIQFVVEEAESLTTASPGDLGQPFLVQTLKEFRQFSEEYSDYIREHHPDDFSGQRQVINKILAELLALRPLIDQRRSARLSDFLRQADVVATDILFRVLGNNPMPSTGGNAVVSAGAGAEGDDRRVFAIRYCLTFFEDVNYVRLARASYRRAPAISVPLSAWRKPWEWMGIAHEVGHCVYWNLDGLSDLLLAGVLANVAQTVSGQRERATAISHSFTLWMSWIEEVFSDILGALLLGPGYVHSMMEFLLPSIRTSETESPDIFIHRLLTDDGVHPIILLRPMAQVMALRTAWGAELAGTEMGSALDRLEVLWKSECARLVQRETSTFEVIWNTRFIIGAPVQVRDCMRMMQPVVQAMVDALLYVPSQGTEVRKKSDFELYSPEVHKQVIGLTEEVVTNSAPTLIDNPAMTLPVAWYTWHTLRRRDPKAEDGAFDPLMKWINSVCVQYAESADLKPSQPDKSSFQHLFSTVQALYKESGVPDEELENSVYDHLLGLEFSTRENQWPCGVGYACQAVA